MPAPELGDTSYYTLRPQTPVRAWALAALALVVGVAACLAGWPEPRRIVLVVIGVLVGLLGVALAIAAAAFVSARTVHIVLSPDGYQVNGPGYHKQGSWIDVDEVAATPDGARLVISSGHVDRTFIQAPGGVADERMQAITTDITRRLEALDVQR